MKPIYIVINQLVLGICIQKSHYPSFLNISVKHSAPTPVMQGVWGEILKPPENSVSQTLLFRYKEIDGLLYRKHRKNNSFNLKNI
jgi:hypothetical protein